MAELSDLESWRSSFLRLALVLGIVFLPIGTIASLPVFLSNKNYLLIIFDVIAWTILVCCFVSKKISYQFNSFVVFSLLYIILIHSFIDLGPMYARPAWLVLCSVLAALIFGIRGAVLSTTLNALVLIALYLLMGPESKTWAMVYSEPTSKWIMFIINLSTVMLMASLSVSFLVNKLDRSLRHERYARLQLVNETEKLRNANLACENEIQQRKETEQALNNSEQRFRALVERSFDAVTLADAEGNIIYESPNVPRITGLDIHSRIGKSGFEIVHPDDLPRARSVFLNILAEPGATVTNLEFRGVRSDGTVWIAECNAVNLLHDPNVRAIVINHRDITERKRLEKEREKLQADLFQVQKMEAIGTLAGGVAHDFNNILAGVMGNLSLLELGTRNNFGNNPERDRYIQEIKELVQRGADLNNQLLGFARRGKTEVGPLDLAHAVEKTADMFGRTRRDLVIHQDFASSLMPVLMDYAQIEQVLLNLFINAGHAMPDGGHLILRADNVDLTSEQTETHGAAPGRFVKLVVADTGVGMDEATRARIFEPFFTTKSVGKGTGLGLASVYGIIKGHGGIITVESELGKGTAFSLFLPTTQIAVKKAAFQTQPIHQGEGTILVVDDESILLKSVAQMLASLGYDVLTAATGRDAIEIVREKKNKLSLVILDLTMPEMSGAKTYEAIRAIAPQLKVLLSSGYSIEGQAQELLARGCCGFLKKPYDLGIISAKLKEVL
jgi:two-component system, cell cycle sensor histidine kinase and response regulator CckA